MGNIAILFMGAESVMDRRVVELMGREAPGGE